MIGALTKKDAFLVVCVLLGTDLLELYFGLTWVPVQGLCEMDSPGLGTIPRMILYRYRIEYLSLLLSRE